MTLHSKYYTIPTPPLTGTKTSSSVLTWNVKSVGKSAPLCLQNKTAFQCGTRGTGFDAGSLNRSDRNRPNDEQTDPFVCKQTSQQVKSPIVEHHGGMIHAPLTGGRASPEEEGEEEKKPYEAEQKSA